jgi:hypothetical protein
MEQQKIKMSCIFVVVGIGSTPTSLLANTDTAFNHREKKYEEREREREKGDCNLNCVNLRGFGVDPRITTAKTS